mgnify:CR=1 FL=1
MRKRTRRKRRVQIYHITPKAGMQEKFFSGREISEDCPMHRGREGKNLDDSAGLTAVFSGGKIGG